MLWFAVAFGIIGLAGIPVVVGIVDLCRPPVARSAWAGLAVGLVAFVTVGWLNLWPVYVDDGRVTCLFDPTAEVLGPEGSRALVDAEPTAQARRLGADCLDATRQRFWGGVGLTVASGLVCVATHRRPRALASPRVLVRAT
ncbi:hypothetical protein K8Z61_09535 [Nocardioides sp. TRM66260-LWL]|uniref:hypothetical protein n=1 Tax=Nocardioides sp. TRM66260-LWL TaxID=2874478 RepID=UPI001CC7EDC8|nr:hypothetical protein [Nocardioides sp. TRM66260-LWL]MBZ5734737.1 hypothetical protein [Nocardioides sp. TRM66260-LWL]